MVRSFLVKPGDLIGSAEENSAHDESLYPLGECLGISESERAAPRAAEDDPGVDFEKFAQLFDVVYEMPGRVIDKVCVGGAFPAASLVEEDDPVDGWVEERAVRGSGAASWSPMEEEDRLTLRIAALFPERV